MYDAPTRPKRHINYDTKRLHTQPHNIHIAINVSTFQFNMLAPQSGGMQQPHTRTVRRSRMNYAAGLAFVALCYVLQSAGKPECESFCLPSHPKHQGGFSLLQVRRHVQNWYQGICLRKERAFQRKQRRSRCPGPIASQRLLGAAT